MTVTRTAAPGHERIGDPSAAGAAPRWSFACSACAHAAPGADFTGVCPACGQPMLVRYAAPPGRDAIAPRWDMWRYRALMPVHDGEAPLSLGEGGTPLVAAATLARAVGAARVWVKNEAVSPTTSFKARGMSASLTRVRHVGVRGLVVPTNGNAGVALAAYAAAAGIPARVYAPDRTPAPIQAQVRAHGAELELVAGHIGDAGAVDETVIAAGARELAETEGIDACPEGGCAVAGLRALLASGELARDAEVVVFNTGSGVAYRG